MRVGIVAGILAALGILFLLANGGESDISGREREGVRRGPGAGISCGAGSSTPPRSITIVEEQGRDRLPAESLAQLTEVRDLLAGAAGQSPEQAKPALEQAVGEARWRLSQVETAADEAPRTS